MPRDNIPKLLQFSVFFRDHWHCRYCLEAVFFNPTLQLLENLSPGHGYYHPHSKTDARLALFRRRFASADHVVPVLDGGPTVAENLVTACWECNLDKRARDPDDFEILDVPDSLASLRWDGLASIYPELPEAKAAWVNVICEFYD